MKLVRRLVEGVGAWLQFETHCNRRGLFSERYLSAPIGQILGAVYGSNVHAEAPHPMLVAQQTGQGKRPRLDFAAFDESQKFLAAVESKWIGASTPTLDQIVWDLIRLELISAKFDAECCFILGGRKRDLNKLFGSADFRGKTIGHRKPLLPLSPGSRDRYRMRSAPFYRWDMHRRILSKWQKLEVAEIFELICAEPWPSTAINDQFQVYGWSVRAVKDRVSFVAGASKNYRVPGTDLPLDESP
jgi:hypothetical protein